MSVESLYRDPQQQLSKLRNDSSHVHNIANNYINRLHDSGGLRLNEIQIVIRLREDALGDARGGLLQPPARYRDQEESFEYVTDVFGAASELGLEWVSFTPKDKLDYVMLAALSRSVHLLNRATDLRSARDSFNYGIPASWAGRAQNLVNLHFDKFGYTEIERHYFPKPIESRSPRMPASDDWKNKFFYTLLDRTANTMYHSEESILTVLKEYEYASGQVIDAELRTALFTLFNLNRARYYLYANLHRDEIVIPKYERGEAFEMLTMAKDFTLAKIELMAKEDLGIDLSKFPEKI